MADITDLTFSALQIRRMTANGVYRTAESLMSDGLHPQRYYEIFNRYKGLLNPVDLKRVMDTIVKELLDARKLFGKVDFDLLDKLKTIKVGSNEVHMTSDGRAVLMGMDNELNEHSIALEYIVSGKKYNDYYNFFHRLTGEKPILLIAHGGTVDKTHVVQNNAGSLIQTNKIIEDLNLKFPNRPVIVVSCNPDNVSIKNIDKFDIDIVYATENIRLTEKNSLPLSTDAIDHPMEMEYIIDGNRVKFPELVKDIGDGYNGMQYGNLQGVLIGRYKDISVDEMDSLKVFSSLKSNYFKLEYTEMFQEISDATTIEYSYFIDKLYEYEIYDIETEEQARLFIMNVLVDKQDELEDGVLLTHLIEQSKSNVLYFYILVFILSLGSMVIAVKYSKSIFKFGISYAKIMVKYRKNPHSKKYHKHNLKRFKTIIKLFAKALKNKILRRK